MGLDGIGQDGCQQPAVGTLYNGRRPDDQLLAVCIIPRLPWQKKNLPYPGRGYPVTACHGAIDQIRLTAVYVAIVFAARDESSGNIIRLVDQLSYIQLIC